MDAKKKKKFLKWYNFFEPKMSDAFGKPYSGEIEECQNGYTLYVYNFQDFMEVLNLLGQMAAQFNASYGYEEDPNKITDYQITVIDFDENFQKRSAQYI